MSNVFEQHDGKLLVRGGGAKQQAQARIKKNKAEDLDVLTGPVEDRGQLQERIARLEAIIADLLEASSD